jgi:hypothetical protein
MNIILVNIVVFFLISKDSIDFLPAMSEIPELLMLWWKVSSIPFQNWCMKADNNICTIYNNLYFKNKPYYSFKIKQRSDDFSYILVKIDFSLKGKREPWNMKITQYPGDDLKCIYVKPREDMVNHREIKDSIFRIYEGYSWYWKDFPKS